MAGDKPKFGEQFAATVKRADGAEIPRDSEEGKKIVRRRRGVGSIIIGGILAVIAAFFIGHGVHELASTSGETLNMQEGVTAIPSQEDPVLMPSTANEIVPDRAAQIADQKKRGRVVQGYLTVVVYHPDGSKGETYGPYKNTIVNDGEDFLVDAFQGAQEPETIRYHAIGTSSAAVAETQSACQSELTTEYSSDNTRATGSLAEGSGTNVFRTVGTNTVDSGVTIEEFCLMTNATVGSGVMWTRILTGSITLSASDSLQTTYDLTVE